MITGLPWPTKAAALAVLSRVPLGERAYRRLQDLSGSSQLDAETIYDDRASFVIKLFQHRDSLEGITALEVGTGWHPVTPVLLSLLGAKKVITVDLNPWLSARSIQETLSKMSDLWHRIDQDFSELEPGVSRRLAHLREIGELRPLRMSDALDLLASLGIEYHCPMDAATTSLPDDSVDLVISTNVFEHIPPDVLDGIVKESYRILRPDGLHAASINPGDHFSIGREEITGVNFLKYGPRVWHWIGGSGLAYHNRLRCVDYERMIYRSGFEISQSDTRIEPESLAALEDGELVPHEDFEHYTNEQLAGYVIHLIGTKREADSVADSRKVSSAA
jgi:SAM-dependent methyltransferase